MIHDELRRWNQQHAEPLRKFIQPHTNDRNPDRRLRIGYVSPGFPRPSGGVVSAAPAGRGMITDTSRCSATPNVPAPIAVTERIRAACE